MRYTKEEIIKRITTQLDKCLESANAEIYNYDDKTRITKQMKKF